MKPKVSRFDSNSPQHASRLDLLLLLLVFELISVAWLPVAFSADGSRLVEVRAASSRGGQSFVVLRRFGLKPSASSGSSDAAEVNGIPMPLMSTRRRPLWGRSLWWLATTCGGKEIDDVEAFLTRLFAARAQRPVDTEVGSGDAASGSDSFD